MKKPQRMTPQAAAAMASADKRRMILMVIGVVLLGGGYFWAQTQKTSYEEVERDNAPELAQKDEPNVQVVVPEFDRRDVLENVRDRTTEGRLVVEGEALDVVFDYGRLLTWRHYDALNATPVDAAAVAALSADPAAHRVGAYRARGEVVERGKRRRNPSRPEEITGTLRTDDGQYVHFVVLEADEDIEVGKWARVDGMFLKLYRTEAPTGMGADGWFEGPLLCGADLVRSYAPVDLEGVDFPLASLDGVLDDTLETGANGIPDDAKWELMSLAWADRMGAADIDWDAAPLLDGQTIGELFLDGEDYRGKPFRLDVSQNLGGWTEREGENPMRLARTSAGWIGNQTWKGQVPLFYWMGPFDLPEITDRLGKAHYVTGRGFFLKNMAYEKNKGDLGRAPVFVMAAVDTFTPAEDERTEALMFGVLGTTIGLAALLWFLLARDKTRAKELQAELVRRRRARRAQDGTPNLANGGEPA